MQRRQKSGADCYRGRNNRDRGGDRGTGTWKAKGSILSERLPNLERTATATARLISATPSAGEYLPNSAATREDTQRHADKLNLETFGECAGWDAESMFQAHREAPVLPKSAPRHLVGTCGFMGVAPNRYVRRFPVVELNCTFHDQGNRAYARQASTYARLGLRVVVKVSGYATHVRALEGPKDWWPWLRSKYAPFINAGILVAFLWQLPPSFVCTQENLGRLDDLGALLRADGQMPTWVAFHHVFEFRDNSWYGNLAVTKCLESHALNVAMLHVVNDTGWAGNLASGWHTREDASKHSFIYIRCFGSGGRSIGKYSISDLLTIAEQARDAQSVVVMFGQGDVPAHAIENAGELKEIFQTGRISESTQQWLALAPSEESSAVIGRVVAVGRGWDRRVFLDINGRRGYLGSRHSRKRGLRLKVGEVVHNLRIEAEAHGMLILSVHSCRSDEATAAPTDAPGERRQEPDLLAFC